MLQLIVHAPIKRVSCTANVKYDNHSYNASNLWLVVLYYGPVNNPNSSIIQYHFKNQAYAIMVFKL